MSFTFSRRALTLCALTLFTTTALAQAVPPEKGQRWVVEQRTRVLWIINMAGDHLHCMMAPGSTLTVRDVLPNQFLATYTAPLQLPASGPWPMRTWCLHNTAVLLMPEMLSAQPPPYMYELGTKPDRPLIRLLAPAPTPQAKTATKTRAPVPTDKEQDYLRMCQEYGHFGYLVGLDRDNGVSQERALQQLAQRPGLEAQTARDYATIIQTVYQQSWAKPDYIADSTQRTCEITYGTRRDGPQPGTTRR
jgi:hypothetical protein